MKKLNRPIIIFGAILAIVLIVFTIFSVKSMAPKGVGTVPERPMAAKIVFPVDLTGTWKTTDKTKLVITAKIEQNAIDMKMGDETTQSNYWYGSFENPISDPAVITSKVLDNGQLYLSSATSKDFNYKDGKLTFQFSALGTTSTLEMIRV